MELSAEGCGFFGSWGTVGRPLLLVALIGLLPLAKGLYRGIVRRIGVVIMAVAAAEAAMVCCHWRVFLSSYVVGLPYKILRRK